MTEPRGGLWAELFKYPVFVASLVLALVLLDWSGIRILSMNLSEGSVELERQGEIAAHTAELTSSVKELEAQIVELREKVDLSSQDVADTEQRHFESQGDVSDRVANLVRRPGEAGRTYSEGREGWIWVGNSSSPEVMQVENSRLATVHRAPVAELRGIAAGDTLTVLGNMTMRARLPKNDAAYYHGVPKAGIVPRGTRVEILSADAPGATGAAVPIDREFATQWWVRVRVAE